VTTDVGSCSELIFGLPGDDAALGAAGDVVRIADPAALANAALGLLQHPDRWQAAQASGIARVEKYYTQEQMVGSYRTLYTELMAMPDNTRREHGASPAKCPVHHGAQAGGR